MRGATTLFWRQCMAVSDTLSMDKLFASVNGDPRLASGDSFCDRLNSRYTVTLFFFFSIIVTLKQHYVGQ